MTGESNRLFPVISSFEDDAFLAKRLSEEIANCIREAIRTNGRARIVLSGGATPQKSYLFLSKQDVEWDLVDVTLADERWVPSSDPRSNHCLLNMTLFEALDKKPNFISLYREGQEPEEAIEAVNQAVSNMKRPFDLVLLGMGRDGHTASLFPQGDQLEQAMDLEDTQLARVIHAPEAKEPRVTLTLNALLNSKRIILAFSGARKFKVFEQAMKEGADLEMSVRAILRQARVPVDVFYSLGQENKGSDVLPASAATQPIYKNFEDTRGYWERIRKKRITALFSQNEKRFQEFSLQAEGILFDYSKTKLDNNAVQHLLDMARAAGVEDKRNDMFSGYHINKTEGRAVGHAALRNFSGEPYWIDGRDVMPEVLSTLEQVKLFADKVRSGAIVSSSGEQFTDVVNIGIGGSDLGPAMATLALAPYCDGPQVHFVSNVDGAHIWDTLKGLNPETTLFLIASKTFTTLETLTNAATAKQWLIDALGEDGVNNHLAALSSAVDKAKEFGVPEQRIFGYWDWVGGRYSVWCAIGLSLMIAIGTRNFEAFLKGAHAIDRHFQSAPLEKNLPVMMALTGVWHSNICGYRSRAVIPYDQRLTRLPAYLQQLDMESNGKRVDVFGNRVPYHTGPVVWGEPGTNGQHAFFQLLHQGTQVIPVEFLAAADGHEDHLREHHELLLSNVLAQAEALMNGRTRKEAEDILLGKGVTEEKAKELAPHMTFPGDRPSTMLLYPKLTPYVLGQLIALYEHRVFVEGSIWGINSFDQWGVELGKQLAQQIYPHIKENTSPEDSVSQSTSGLISWLAQQSSREQG